MEKELSILCRKILENQGSFVEGENDKMLFIESVFVVCLVLDCITQNPLTLFESNLLLKKIRFVTCVRA